jgi:hypothetical protein
MFPMALSLDEVLELSQADLRAIVLQAAPLDLDAVADSTYTGIDLSMPSWFHKLMWKSFRKTFYRDPDTGIVRGWNVRVEQSGWETPPAPLRNRSGAPITFGHYELRSAAGVSFPGGWNGAHYLDYRTAGNRAWDVPARWGTCPLVAVNEGNSDLLLGWEIFTIAGARVPLPDFWLLRREGDIRAEDVVPRPDGRTPAMLTAPSLVQHGAG